ncbi:hypothetical protein JCM9492_08530 [Aquifex pyrophilus]
MLLALVFAVLGFVFGFTDSDLDGVEDSLDKCPNTPFFVLVDRYGCPVKELRPRRRVKFFFRTGFSHAKDKDYESNSVYYSLSASIKPFYFSLSSRYYTYVNGKSGMGNIYLSATYRKYFKNLGLYPGLRLKIPTSEKFGDKYLAIAPSLYAVYILRRSDISLYIERTFRSNSSLRDTWSFSAGAGYELRKLYLNISLDLTESSVRSRYYPYLTLFSLLDLTDKLFLTLTFSKGLSEEAVDRSLSLKLGIRF